MKRFRRSGSAEVSHAIRCMLRSPHLTAQRSMHSTGPLWPPAAETMDNRECERSTIRTTTPHSFTIPTATTSKWCAARNDREVGGSDFAVDLLVDQNCEP